MKSKIPAPDEIAAIIVKALDNKKAQEIKLLKTFDVTILADYFVICTASSSTHLKTLSDFVEAELKNKDIRPLRREGEKTNEWMLIDYGSVVLHIFLEKGREFYKLEHLWNDADDIDITSIIKDNK